MDHGFIYNVAPVSLPMAATMHCPECPGRLQHSHEETICADCGLVIAEDNIDRGPEWRTFEGEPDRRRRTGAPLTRSRHDMGLGSTRIGRGTSQRLTGRKRRRIARMRRQHNRAQFTSKAERNQMAVFKEIDRICTRLSLPETICEQSCDLFRSAQRENIVQGRSLEGFAAACVYASCRIAQLARTIDEVVEVADSTESELRSAFDALNRELGLPIGPIDPREYLPRYASKLDIAPPIEARARKLVELAYEASLIGGRNPSGVAAACLYSAAKEAQFPLTQRAIADVAHVTPVTLRQTYHHLRDNDFLHLPNE